MWCFSSWKAGCGSWAGIFLEKPQAEACATFIGQTPSDRIVDQRGMSVKLVIEGKRGIRDQLSGSRKGKGFNTEGAEEDGAEEFCSGESFDLSPERTGRYVAEFRYVPGG